MVSIGNQKCRLGPKLRLIILKINDVLIIINYTVMQRIAHCGDSEEQGEESPAAN